ncbi:MAG TPA: hypothetical protein VHL11_03280, partial [Phototrophicaceae bacterium]|nr:hypothetical protein [Phototrophicaceae bacterium]
VHANPKALGEELYSQSGVYLGRLILHDFEPAMDPFDAQGADDFIVPAEGWTIGGFLAVGELDGGALPVSGLTANVWFYDTIDDLPGNEVCTYPAVPVTDTTNDDLLIELPTPCTLGAGHYWVGTQVILDSTVAQWGWEVISTSVNNGAAFQNPGDGFQTGCITWTDLGTCAQLGQPLDLTYTLYASLTQNLVDNSGFEATDGARSTRAAVLDPWVLKNGTGDKIKTDTETKIVAHSGVSAFQFKGGVGESSKIQQVIDLTSLTFNVGDILDGSLFVNASKPTAAGKVKVVVAYSDADSGKAVTTLGTTSGYQGLVLDTITLASANVTKIKVQIKHSSPTGKVYVDDVVLNWTPAAAANGLIPLP